MKKIVRLTESDLVNIVKRVISEQKTPPIVDAGYSRDMQGYVIALSQPTISAGSGYKGIISAQVKFNGVRINYDGTPVTKGNITLYALCGPNYNPGALSPRSTEDVFADGSKYVFQKGGLVDKMVRNFCQSKGQPSSPTAGLAGEHISGARKALSMAK
jgi:hypothetical protein